jgi:hypothetical protein
MADAVDEVGGLTVGGLTISNFKKPLLTTQSGLKTA